MVYTPHFALIINTKRNKSAECRQKSEKTHKAVYIISRYSKLVGINIDTMFVTEALVKE